jgi:hypothetical protein
VSVRLGDILSVGVEKRLVVKPPPPPLRANFFVEGRRAYLVFDSAEVILTVLDDCAIVELVRVVPWNGSVRRISQTVSFLAEELSAIEDVAVAVDGRVNLFLVSEIRQRLEGRRERKKRV